MLRLFKKLRNVFKPVEKLSLPENIVVNPYTRLIERLRFYASREEHLIRLLKDPVNKLYLLNTYSVSFDDLLRNIAYKDFNRKINAVNCYSYFKGSLDGLGLTFERIATMLEQGLKLSSMIEHDLLEILDGYDYLS